MTKQRLVLVSRFIIACGAIWNLATIIYLLVSPLFAATSGSGFTEILGQLPGVVLVLAWAMVPYFALWLLAAKFPRLAEVSGAGVAILGLDIIFTIAILISSSSTATMGFILKPLWSLLLLPIGFAAGGLVKQAYSRYRRHA